MAEPSDAGSVGGDRQALLSLLVEHRVEFVLIGGAAIQTHGRRYDTLDVDVAPDNAPENLSRLACALNALGCRLVTDPADPASWVALPSDYFTPRTLLAANIWNLATRYGLLDLTFAPSGFPGGYRDLAPRATRQLAAGTSITVAVAALEDIHESKRMATRRTSPAGWPGREPDRAWDPTRRKEIARSAGPGWDTLVDVPPLSSSGACVNAARGFADVGAPHGLVTLLLCNACLPLPLRPSGYTRTIMRLFG